MAKPGVAEVFGSRFQPLYSTSLKLIHCAVIRLIAVTAQFFVYTGNGPPTTPNFTHQPDNLPMIPEIAFQKYPVTPMPFEGRQNGAVCN
jgi:hypothetical protein